MSESGYLIDSEGNEVELCTGLVYGDVWATANDTTESKYWQSIETGSKTVGCLLEVPTMLNGKKRYAFTDAIYIEGGFDEPLRIKKIVLPDNVKEVVLHQILIDEPMHIPVGITSAEIDIEVTVSNLSDFIEPDTGMINFFGI